jgi:hypothetical protein
MTTISEAEKVKIEKEARDLLAKLSKTLSNVKIAKKEKKESAGGFRIEGKGMKGDEDFRERMFANAATKSDECIIAEKKKW